MEKRIAQTELQELADILDVMLAQDPLGKPPAHMPELINRFVDITSETFDENEELAAWFDEHIATPLYATIDPDAVDSDMLPEPLGAIWNWEDSGREYDPEHIYRAIFTHTLGKIQNYLSDPIE